MKSEMHQRAFLVCKLLQKAGYLDLIMMHLGNRIYKREIYIYNHSHHFSAIIISDEAVGIDMELQRDKIRIADKFCDSEFQFLNHDVRIH
jgi:hypothetical protein